MRGLTIAFCLLQVFISNLAVGEPLRVGSKRFTESYLLSEIVAQTAAPFVRVEQKPGLGNTAIVFEALKSGNIDIYPEYLGTIDLELLKHHGSSSLAQINRELAPMGLAAGIPLGFNNTYALAMRAADGKRTGIRNLSDLAQHSELRLGLSHEFLGRADGWPGLAQRYGLTQHPTGLDHGIAYQALANANVDVIDIYSTDAQIRRYGLTVLDDDAGYFPRYDAVLLYRLDIAQRFPQAWKALQNLQGRISESDMVAMNAAAELDGKSFADIARAHSNHDTSQNERMNFLSKLFDGNLWHLTLQHVTLVALSVLAASLFGIPIGIVAAYYRHLRQGVMAVVGVLQTIPSLALLAMLIPLLGKIGAIPALIALFLYALLPIVRNTCTGIEQVPREMRLAAMALGLRPLDRLRFVILPLASPVILTGVKTAAVMSVGTATIAAFIGAGGYGERIATGLALNDNGTLLAGAIPAAVLALVTQFMFEAVERLMQRRAG